MESVVRHIAHNQAKMTRCEVTNIFENSKLQKTNISFSEAKALRVLRANIDIQILDADKTQSTVVMPRCDYDNRIKDLL